MMFQSVVSVVDVSKCCVSIVDVSDACTFQSSILLSRLIKDRLAKEKKRPCTDNNN